MWEAAGEIGSSVFQALAETLRCCKHVCAEPQGFGTDPSAQRTSYKSKVIDLQNPWNHAAQAWICNHVNLSFYRVSSETMTLCLCYSSVFILY